MKDGVKLNSMSGAESAELLTRRWREARRRFREDQSSWETEWRRALHKAPTPTRRATGR